MKIPFYTKRKEAKLRASGVVTTDELASVIAEARAVSALYSEDQLVVAVTQNVLKRLTLAGKKIPLDLEQQIRNLWPRDP